MKDTGTHSHERRYGSPAERLRAPTRVALLEIPRVVSLCMEGITAVRVLDVGTGHGALCGGIRAQRAGRDRASIPMRSCSRLRGGTSTGAFLRGTAEKLPFEDRSFDLVMLAHVLHETDDPSGCAP